MSSDASDACASKSSGRAAAAASSVPVAWIDTGALAGNLGEVHRLVGPRVGVLAMVKSDAYGHGATVCASALAAAGCRAFGVASAAEAAEIKPVLGTLAAAAGASGRAGGADRASGAAGTPRVVVFGGLLPAEAGAVLAAGAEVVTQEIEVVRALGERARACGTEAVVHVKIDTGMHRLGVAPRDVVDFVRTAAAIDGVRVVAICSHFAQAESVTGKVTAGQLEHLLGADAALRDAGFTLARHLANSAAILSRPQTHLDMVRPGIMLYGVAPDPSLRGRAGLRPVMRLAARVVRVADIAAGEGIGYGHTCRTSRPSRIATIRCGYADGFPRSLGNVASCRVGAARAPVAGRICMDHTMIDVTDTGDVDVGDEVTMWGDDPGVDEVAAWAGTISYELLARVGRRVRREPSQPEPD